MYDVLGMDNKRIIVVESNHYSQIYVGRRKLLPACLYGFRGYPRSSLFSRRGDTTTVAAAAPVAFIAVTSTTSAERSSVRDKKKKKHFTCLFAVMFRRGKARARSA